MDVPETGAVFAFGRSHLTISGDGSDNNYFFIKKDRIKRLICGRNQSAVICESGRLFVWGENPCGQLAIGTCENVVTKPSCVKHIKKMGHSVRDFQFGSNFSILLTDSNKVFFAGKNVFPFNAKVESLAGKLQHNIAELPIELEEFSHINEKFVSLKAGDDHFVLLNGSRDKLYGWGFNSHHQLATIDSLKVLHAPDVCFKTEDGEPIKLMECGKLSTCVVTEFNDLFIVGKFGFTTIPTFTKIREPIINSTIVQLHISDDDDIYLVTECGLVFKSNDFRNIMDLRFDQMKIPKLSEKIVKVAPGNNFLSILTESGRCFSMLSSESNLIESGKLKNLRVVDICAGTQHVLVSTMMRGRDLNGNQEQEPVLNQTYTINFKPIKGLGSGTENYQEPDTGENLRAPINCEDFEQYQNGVVRKSSQECENMKSSCQAADIIAEGDKEASQKQENGNNDSSPERNNSSRNIGSRATTLEAHDTQSSGHSSAQKVSPNRSDSTIRFIDNGVDKTPEDSPDTAKPKLQNGSVRLSIEEIEEEYEDEEHRKIQRKKTPMPRARKTKPSATEEDLDENGIIDRDEDLYNDDDDVSTSTLHGSDDSLEDYIREENKVNAEKSNGPLANGKVKWRQFVANVKDKGKGLSCKNTDHVIAENDAHLIEDVETTKDNSKPCSIM